jgi:hypothetical protein
MAYRFSGTVTVCPPASVHLALERSDPVRTSMLTVCKVSFEQLKVPTLNPYCR